MIKLSSKHTLVLDPCGQSRSLDVDTIRADLHRCFRRCGMGDPWAADHIAMVIEEQLSERDAGSLPALREADVQALVCALLDASGFADVGEAYRDLHGGSPARPPAALPWDADRLLRVIGAAGILSRDKVEDAVARTIEALHRLELASATDELIRQLAINLHGSAAVTTASAAALPARDAILTAAAGLAESPIPSPRGSDREAVWLLRHDDWPRRGLSVAAGEAIAAGVILASPVSRLLPRLRVVLDVGVLAGRCGLPLTELCLLPALQEATAAAAEWTQAAGAAVASRLGHEPLLPPRLLAASLDQVIAHAVVPLCPRGRLALRQEARCAVRDRFQRHCGQAALVSFRG